MTESQISALLDATYELEALLSLSQIRQGAPERIADLIRMKADTIITLAYDGKPDPDIVDPDIATPALETDNTSDTYSLEEDEEEEEVFPTDEAESAEEYIVEKESANPAEETTPEDEAETEAEPEEEAEDKTEPEEEITEIVETPPTPAVMPKTGTDISVLQRLFSLNDKFRFRRELFNGNDEEFTATLQMIAKCDTLTDAEAYIYSDLQWDPDSEAVKAFIGVIANYFN